MKGDPVDQVANVSLPATTRCATPACAALIKQYGERYHRVIERKPDNVYPWDDHEVVAVCEGCGGRLLTSGEWRHRCGTCGVAVEAGGLVGMFVRNACPACWRKVVDGDIKAGRVCGRCQRAYAECCC